MGGQEKGVFRDGRRDRLCPLQPAGRIMFGPNVTFGVSNVVVSTVPGKGCVGGEPAGQGLEITRAWRESS